MGLLIRLKLFARGPSRWDDSADDDWDDDRWADAHIERDLIRRMTQDN